MTPETAAKLREPFPAEHVGKLPRVYCKACRDSQYKVCQQHERRKCRDCGSNITTAHLHLDYVGHAEITDRLLQVDPAWTWEPVALGAEGLPLLDRNGGLWIRLTVVGVTRLGYGHADGKSGPDAVKEAIGDALRNSAMRFGVALDLWGAKFKEDSDAGDGAERQAPWDAEQTGEGPEGWVSARPRPDRGQIVTKAAEAIATAQDRETLEKLELRVMQRESEGAITADDAITLRRLIVARLDELYPDATPRAGAPTADEWPEPVEVPS